MKELLEAVNRAADSGYLERVKVELLIKAILAVAEEVSRLTIAIEDRR